MMTIRWNDMEISYEIRNNKVWDLTLGGTPGPWVDSAATTLSGVIKYFIDCDKRDGYQKYGIYLKDI